MVSPNLSVEAGAVEHDADRSQPVSARDRLAAEWRAQNPTTEAEIAAFYRTAIGLRDDLDDWHTKPMRQHYTAIVVAAVQAQKAQRILDVGAGAGHDLRAVHDAVPEATLVAVEPNTRLRDRLPAVAYPRIDLVPEEPLFDLQICIDVLEHVPDPAALLAEMIKRLRMGGVLIEATATCDPTTPLHLPHLRGWSPARMLDAHGFVCRETVDRLRIWQRIQERRGDEPTLILCAYRQLTAETHEAILELCAAGWRYKRHGNDALVTRVRSIAASQWYRETAGDVFLMVDDDIQFSVQDAEKVVALAREKRGIACGAYPVRGGGHLACRPLNESIVFGPKAPPVEIEYAATGFMAVHRDVIAALIEDFPLCHETETWAFWPIFDCLIAERDAPWGVTYEYLSEDWAFCRRARDKGFGVWLDPSVALTHYGSKGYTVATMPDAVPEPGPGGTP
ncbi:MAG: methyltransferase domain-containing protein [Dehalococcoidia bacterium]